MRKIFIDGGARLGESIDIIQKYMPEYIDFEFYLFEPNSEHKETLLKLSNNNDNINFINGAIWDKNDKCEFFIANDIWGDLGSTLHFNKKEKLNRDKPLIVDTYDIIDIIEQFSESDYLVLKLDVEGSEYEIINRLINTGMIRRIKEYLIEWHDNFYDDPNKKSKNYIHEIQKCSIYKSWQY
jgi:FkbM family methyltransferase